jgi:SPP1 gp7 family putative phage head morphogenesis protein
VDPKKQILANQPESVNLAWFDALVRHQIYLLRFSGSVTKDIVRLLNATERDIATRIQMALSGKRQMSPARLRKAERLLKQLKAIRSRAWDEAEQLWIDSMNELTAEEVRLLQRTVATVVPVELDTALPSSAKLKALVTNHPFEGKTLRSWAKNIRRADLERIEAQVRIGIVQGESAQAISRRVVGTARLRGRDGVTQITRNNAAAITRTAVNHFSNAAREDFFGENSDIFTREIFVATLDSRTTPVCRANDGKRFPIGRGPIPPLHFSCRSLRVAEINGEAIGERPAKPVTEKMLLREFAEKNQLGRITSRADLPYGWKGKFDSFAGRRVREMVGRVPAKMTYQEWLGRQSVAFQDDVLGPTRGRLFRKGNLELSTFVDRKGRQIPLADLADTEAAAFRAAGLDPADY